MSFLKEQMEEFKRQQGRKSEHDPRPDLSLDHDYWELVLKEAKEINNYMHGNLHGFRCAGAKLELNDGEFELIPDINSDNWVWPNKKAYKADREEFLIPYAKEIKELFKKVANRCQN